MRQLFNGSTLGLAAIAVLLSGTVVALRATDPPTPPATCPNLTAWASACPLPNTDPIYTAANSGCAGQTVSTCQNHSVLLNGAFICSSQPPFSNNKWCDYQVANGEIIEDECYFWWQCNYLSKTGQCDYVNSGVVKYPRMKQYPCP
jgi:hypothetical protein